MEQTFHDFSRWYGHELTICTEVNEGELTKVRVIEERDEAVWLAMEPEEVS